MNFDLGKNLMAEKAEFYFGPNFFSCNIRLPKCKKNINLNCGPSNKPLKKTI